MPHMDYGQIEITTQGYTHTVYETCGSSNCHEKVLKALGIGDERFTDADTFRVTGEDGVRSRIVLRHHLDEQDSCTWCYGCGDFLVHGLSCECKKNGHIEEDYEDREPLEPMVDVTGVLELRPFREAK